MMFENKESDFIGKINTLTHQLKSQDDRHKSKTTGLRLDNEALQRDLEKANKEKTVIESHMKKEIGFLKTKLEQHEKLALKKASKVDKVRAEYQDRF